jgi:hypothetical protein
VAKKFTDQESGKKFLDKSSSGKKLPLNLISYRDHAVHLNSISGGDKIVNYAFSAISGEFDTGNDGDFDIEIISSSPVTSAEMDYITGTLSFIGSKIGVQFIQSTWEDADMRFFADVSTNKAVGFATVSSDPVDIVWSRSKSRLVPNDKLTISHEICHGLGLDHIDEISGMSEKKMFKKWGVSDSLMISWELYDNQYNKFSDNHQWVTKNDISALQGIWSDI